LNIGTMILSRALWGVNGGFPFPTLRDHRAFATMAPMKIFVTGGSSEIAAAVIRRQVSAGHEIMATASSEDSLEGMLALYSSERIPIQGCVLDLAQPEAASTDVSRFLDKADAVILIASSKAQKLRRFHEYKDEQMELALATDIRGNLWLLKRALPGMVERRFGRLVYFSSVSVASGMSRYPLYNLVKAGMEGLFLNLAVDYGEYNILSNTVRPGIIATRRNRRYWSRESYVKKMERTIPQGRLGNPDQVAEVIDVLLSPSSYVNGAVLPVSGGLPMIRTEGILED
jgi:3-oxoacyl-[acyl-carrier protein] reductase